MPEFREGDRVGFRACGVLVAGKVVQHDAWRPLFSHWVQTTHGMDELKRDNSWLAHQLVDQHHEHDGLLYVFDEELEHID
ncbi:hypothetical protein SEA_PERIWINKLE_52 [Gordonia phage Periwinkle]|nr:hypothetical protein SEA_PERIWINKLE_52 [Gordonia phage Periwinkle]